MTELMTGMSQMTHETEIMSGMTEIFTERTEIMTGLVVHLNLFIIFKIHKRNNTGLVVNILTYLIITEMT